MSAAGRPTAGPGSKGLTRRGPASRRALAAAVGLLLVASSTMVGAGRAGASFGGVAGGARSVTTARIFPGTRSTSAFVVADASGGATAINLSDPTAQTDSRRFTSGAFSAAFAATRYVDFTLAAPLAQGLAVTGASLELTFAASGGGTACVYVELRRASPAAVLGTYGSSAAPLACSSSTTQALTTAALAGLTSSTDADNVTVRVYGRSTTSRSIAVDRLAVTGMAHGPFTLVPTSRVDASTGTAGTAVRWALAGTDSTYLTSASNWTSTFTTARSLTATFPTVVPAEATITGASVRHRYASAGAGTTCYWFEVRGGGNLLGTHGSAATPLSCNATTTMATDTVALPELTSGAPANGVVLTLYVRQSSAGKSRHDALVLDLTYRLT